MLGLGYASNNRWAILDFVCPREEYRQIVDADVVVFMDTIKSSDFPDTNAIFERPVSPDFRFTAKEDVNVMEVARAMLGTIEVPEEAGGI